MPACGLRRPLIGVLPPSGQGLRISPRHKQILGAKIGSEVVRACAAVRHTAKR
jgi:hypothetical protein